MTILVADVGGTNCRFALGDAGGVPRAVVRLSNDDHAGFDAAMEVYLAAQGHPRLMAACFAVAGPVSQGRADLTNRDWHFDAAALSARLGAPVRLINDLAALGHALPGLTAQGRACVREPARPDPNGQSLVLGLGTGVNASVVVARSGPPVILECEAGHPSLPTSVARALPGRLAAEFASIEDLFAGRGLAHLHGVLNGTPLDGPAIIAAHAAGDARATATLDLFARALGAWAQQIALQYLPRDGLYLAGSVARGVIGAGFGATVAASFAAPHPFADLIGRVPLRLLIDDMAALSGCLAAV